MAPTSLMQRLQEEKSDAMLEDTSLKLSSVVKPLGYAVISHLLNTSLDPGKATISGGETDSQEGIPYSRQKTEQLASVSQISERFCSEKPPGSNKIENEIFNYNENDGPQMIMKSYTASIFFYLRAKHNIKGGAVTAKWRWMYTGGANRQVRSRRNAHDVLRQALPPIPPSHLNASRSSLLLKCASSSSVKSSLALYKDVLPLLALTGEDGE
ncbi:hypothetical protein J6590_084632 [Homalodisca vitripennis]|nr:hypothetical protein J6590_084632 [Homalodisca vitripennis]